MAKRVLGNGVPTRLRRELDGRVDAGTLSARQARWLIPALIHDLRHDQVTGNAERAMRQLEVVGSAAVKALSKALASDDYQQRQLAAWMLRAFSPTDPSDALLRVTVEGLRDDDLGWEPRNGRYLGIQNAGMGAGYLAALQAEPNRSSPLRWNPMTNNSGSTRPRWPRTPGDRDCCPRLRQP